MFNLKLSVMKKNMGLIDKVVRILVAIVVIALYFTNVISGVLAIILLIFAGVFILTSLLGFCPLYIPFGLNTGKKE
jgi:hypothetical protein